MTFMLPWVQHVFCKLPVVKIQTLRVGDNKLFVNLECSCCHEKQKNFENYSISSTYDLKNPNTIKSYKISQKLSPKHAARGVAQSPYPIYRHGKACLSKQPPWCAAGDPCLACGMAGPGFGPQPRRTCCARFVFSTLPSFLLREIVFFAPSLPNP